MTISEMKAMWLLAMFDLPMKTKMQKREYSRFRKFLIGEGFVQLQLSVYAKFCSTRENAYKYCNYITAAVPPNGQVRVIMITDKQFGEMISLYGKTVQEVEKKPEQLLLF